MANRTVFLNYEVNDLDSDAYSVVLGSEDSSYGIKEYVSGTVVVPDDTSVENPNTGRYEYTFNADDTKVYLVSWKITPNACDQPFYEVQKVGPFIPNSGQIRGATDYRGTFKVDSLATLMLKITDFDGEPQDADYIMVYVKDTNGVVQDSAIPEKAAKGFYIYDWDIPSTQTTGEYIVEWQYTINDTDRVEIQNVVVAADEIDTSLYSGQVYEIRLALEHYLYCAQNIPVYFEQAKPSIDNKTFRFSFPRWNQTTGVKIYRNQNQIVDSGVNIDYFKGTIRFDNELTDFDTINADYTFRWFSDEELHEFLVNATRTLNQYPPHSGYKLNTLAERYIPLVIKQAAVDALRRIMLCLQFQEPQQVFGGSEGADKAFSNFDGLKKNYEEEIKSLYEQKKYGPYVGLTRTVVTPEYTLPGGRSLSPYSTSTYKILNGLYTKKLELSIRDAFVMHEEVEEMRILSQDESGEVVFAKVDKIFTSGQKRIYRLKTKKGFEIDASKDHLFFINDDYIPLSEIKIGDNCVCYDGKKIVEDKIFKIIKTEEFIEMYDMDVPSTRNLFMNGIKCHNSRWFRYLFSSGT